MKHALMPIIVGAALFSSAANAAVVVTSTAATRPYSGPAPTYDFETLAPVTGGTIVNTGSPGAHLRPVGSTGNYLAVGPAFGTQAELSLLGFGPVGQFSFLWGSMDIFNDFQILDAANNILFEIDGQAVKDPTAPPAGNINRVVTFTLTDAATQNAAAKVRLLSSRNAFEIDNFAIQAVPETSTWVMMILGMLGVGFAMRRRPAEPAMRIRFS